MFKKALGEMTAVDVVTLCFASLLVVLSGIFADTVDWEAVAVNVVVIFISVFGVNYIRSRSSSKPVRILHAFYIMPVVVLVFKTVEKLSYAIHGRDYDDVLIAVDRFLFGTNPTQWLYQHMKLSTFSVEFLQVVYFLYYILFIIITTELFFRRKNHEEGGIHDNELEMYRFAVVYGFLLSYVGYLSLPAIGPRFTLHDFASLSKELPGLWLTEPIRTVIDSGENIFRGMTSAESIRVVTRDAFPSGHTDLTVVTIILGFRFRTKTRWAVLILGSGVIIATVFLRYHYVIDILVGTLLAIITLYTTAHIQTFFTNLKNKWAGKEAPLGG